MNPSPSNLIEVSIIILNYNQSKLTLDCVESILRVEKELNYELIVVDNGSKKNELEVLEQGPYRKHYTFVASQKNGGFGYGNNLGAHHAKGNYLAFINNDTYFEKPCFSFLKNFMSNHPDVGVCTTQQWAPNHTSRPSFDHHHGLRQFFFGNSFLENIFGKPKRSATFDGHIEVDFVQGCFMFFRKTVFEEVGGFDPNLFLYYEEMDICTRLQNKGHKAVYHPGSDFYHIHEASTSVSIKTTGAKKAQILYSYLYVLRKNHSITKFSIIKAALFFSYCLKSLFRSKARIVFKALLKYKPAAAGMLYEK